MSFTVFKVCFSITVSDGWSQAVPSFFSLLCLCSEQAFLISIMVHSWCNNILPRMALRAPPVPTHSSSTTRQECFAHPKINMKHPDTILYTILLSAWPMITTPSPRSSRRLLSERETARDTLTRELDRENVQKKELIY